MKQYAQRLFYLLISLLFTNVSPAQDTVQVVTTWIQKNAIPIKHVEAGNDFADLQPLKGILKDVTVVGLGEATHGTREFFQFKHRMLEFLVNEMNFNGFALEASYSACQPINDYVLYGKGDLATVLSGQGYSLWDTEEFSEMINWMRTYNQRVAPEKKVRFYGLDVPYHDLGRRKVLAYLQKYSREQVASTEFLFKKLAIGDEKWPMWQDDFKSQAPIVLPQLQNLIQFLTENQVKLVKASSKDEFEQILKYTKVMEQMLQTITDYSLRSGFMAANLLNLMKSMPEAKFIVSAHNSHINLVTHKGDISLGHDLRAKLGEKYYAICFETSQGSYQTRIWKPEQRVMVGFREDTLAAAPERSLPWYLSRAKLGDLFLNLRTSTTNPIVERWWQTPQLTRDVSWTYQGDPTQFFMKANLKTHYDGILFIEKTSRARPTKNALVRSSINIGF